MGEGVQIVGAVGPNNTEYSVQLDGGSTAVMNARAGQFIPSSTLVSTSESWCFGQVTDTFRQYSQSSLNPGPHRLIITNTASDGGALSIDSFQVFGNGSANSGSSGVPIGVIIGAVVGGVLVLILLLLLAFFLWRRKRSRDDETDRFSMANASYMERVRNINFRFPSLSGRRKRADALSRSPSRGSQDTAVDPELGGVGHTQKKEFGYGFGLAGGPRKWIEGLKSLVVRNPDPVTPPLPVQRQHERPVIDIRPGGGTHGASPGMVTVGLESGVPGPNATSGYNHGQRNPEAAQVWVEGTKRIEEGGRFSDQSLEQAWDGRSNETAGYGSHRRNQSHPAVSTFVL